MKKYLFSVGLASTIFVATFAYLKLTKSSEESRVPASISSSPIKLPGQH